VSDTLSREVRRELSERIGSGSKSFALAGRLLPRDRRAYAFVVYAWCRHADDAIDQALPDDQASALEALRQELRRLYAGQRIDDSAIGAFASVARQIHLPRDYPEELLAGMRMDIERTIYDTLDQLLEYCYRVAGTVGLMMSHVMGVSTASALHAAARLGIAMQLTNICRDVAEDWQLGRLYLPADLLRGAGLPDLHPHREAKLPDTARDALRPVIQQLLAVADGFYRSADEGFAALPWRCAFAIHAAKRIYSAIGSRLARQGYDVGAGRAVVPLGRKLLAVAAGCAATLAELPARARRFPSRYGAPLEALPFAKLELPP
jgi:phytoene synthase